MKPELLGNIDVFDRLDQAYACWEEGMWRKRLLRRLGQFSYPDYKPDLSETGFPVDGAHKTKQLLLESISRGSLAYLLPDYYSKGVTSKPVICNEVTQNLKTLTGKELIQACPKDMGISATWEEFHFPYYLGKWSASSRRIYYIPEDLMLMLETTSLKGLTYRDVHLPFPSFAIALEKPLVTEESKKLDFFLIGEFSRESVAMYGFAQSFSKWKAVDQSLRAKINEAAQKGNLRRFLRLSEKERYQSQIEDNWDALVEDGYSEKDLDCDLEHDLRHAVTTKDSNWTERFFRVFLGLCFYLKTFNNGSHTNVMQPMPKVRKVYAGAKDGPALVSAAEVCRVQSIVKLSEEEKTIIRGQLSRRGGWEVNSHFREGYWRRRPGEGHDPTALKTVWVQPTLVRRDRLPDNALPFGVGKALV